MRVLAINTKMLQFRRQDNAFTSHTFPPTSAHQNICEYVWLQPLFEFWRSALGVSLLFEIQTSRRSSKCLSPERTRRLYRHSKGAHSYSTVSIGVDSHFTPSLLLVRGLYGPRLWYAAALSQPQPHPRNTKPSRFQSQLPDTQIRMCRRTAHG